MTELSGRELDRAIWNALGNATVFGNFSYSIQPWGSETVICHGDDVPLYHQSVDALREVEPGEDQGWHIRVGRYYSVGEEPHWEVEYGDGFWATGRTEPEARARALLAWLKRNATP